MAGSWQVYTTDRTAYKLQLGGWCAAAVARLVACVTDSLLCCLSSAIAGAEQPEQTVRQLVASRLLVVECLIGGIAG